MTPLFRSAAEGGWAANRGGQAANNGIISGNSQGMRWRERASPTLLAPFGAVQLFANRGRT